MPADRLTIAADSLTASFPGKSSEEKRERRKHAEWMRKARLGQRYFTDKSYYEWVGLEGMPLKLVCHFSYVFDQATSHALYTPGGQSSWRVWWDAGHGGLTAREPEMPNRPVRYRVEGDLRDGGNSEKWKIEYSEMR